MLMTVKARLYRSPCGREFFYRPETHWDSGVLLYSPDGAGFFTTKIRAYSSVMIGGFQQKEQLRFEEYHTGLLGTFDFNRDELTFDDETYAFTGEVPPDLHWPLPEFRVPEFLAIIADTPLMLYVSTSYYDPSNERVKAFFGNARFGFDSIHLTDIRRFRGVLNSLGTGTSRIRMRPIDTGTDFVPSWNGIDLEPLDVSDYIIREVHGAGVSVMPRR